MKNDYEAGEYIGEIDGVSYELWFSGIYKENINGGAYSQWFNLYPLDTKEVCPEIYDGRGYVHFMPHRYMTVDKYTRVAENECELSVEKAQEIAEEFFRDMEMEYPVLTTVRPLIWGDETLTADTIYDFPANGYVFTYDYGMEEVSFTRFAYYASDTYMTADEEAHYSMQARVEVYVTDRGVICMYAGNPVETVNMSDKVELLPLQTIKEIMKEEIETGYEKFRFVHMMSLQELEFNRMELIYFRVRDKETAGKYSYIPAWRLSEDLGKVGNEDNVVRNPVIVNAIDGTLVDFYSEM